VLIARARDGRTVVRLKSGDPFLFGRGGEEAQALRAAGIPFEVVPGVTSAIAVPAYAGHPGHRPRARVARDVHHRPPRGDRTRPAVRRGSVGPARPAGRHARLPDGGEAPAGHRAALVAHGLAAATPAAVIERGTLGSQRTIVATIATIAAEAAAAACARRPSSSSARPSGCASTSPGSSGGRCSAGACRDAPARTGRRARRAARGPRRRGRARADDRDRPPPDAAALDRAVQAAGTYDWIVFTSVNGVRVFFERMAALGGDVRALASARIAAIGPETAAELERRLLRPAVVPAEYRAEGLLDALGEGDLRGRRVLLPRAAGARAILPDTLRARGAHVDEVIAYAAVAPADADAEGLRNALTAGAIDAITFTSSSTVRNFAALAGAAPSRRSRAPRPLVACIGPVTAETAREVGLRVDVIAPTYTAAALADALADRFCNAMVIL
jgi:uroporphyrinogen III methyltransferase/synthase